MKVGKVTVGPFAASRENMDAFCQNLYLTYAMNECALQLSRLEAEYSQAVLNADDELAEQKRLELQVFQSSLMLTAHMFDEIDQVST